MQPTPVLDLGLLCADRRGGDTEGDLEEVLTGADGLLAQPGGQLVGEVREGAEDGALLAVDVVEEGAPGDPDARGDVVDGDPAPCVLGDELLCCASDGSDSRGAREVRACTIGHGVHSCTLAWIVQNGQPARDPVLSPCFLQAAVQLSPEAVTSSSRRQDVQ